MAALLLVDDDPPIRRMLERTLAAEGYAVEAAADGGAALAAVERSVPDAIVLDVTMPGLDGLAVTRRLRAKGLRVPILLLTARDAVHERVAGLDAGADDYLVKPFDADELSARVRALLRRNAPAGGETLAFADVDAARPASRAARAAISSSPAARPSCWSCCCATPAASSPARWRSTRCGAARRGDSERGRPLRRLPAPQARRPAADPHRARRRVPARPRVTLRGLVSPSPRRPRSCSRWRWS